MLGLAIRRSSGRDFTITSTSNAKPFIILTKPIILVTFSLKGRFRFHSFGWLAWLDLDLNRCRLWLWGKPLIFRSFVSLAFTHAPASVSVSVELEHDDHRPLCLLAYHPHPPFSWFVSLPLFHPSPNDSSHREVAVAFASTPPPFHHTRVKNIR